MNKTARYQTLRPEYVDVGKDGYLEEWIARRQDATAKLKATRGELCHTIGRLRPRASEYYAPELICAIDKEIAFGGLTKKMHEVTKLLQKKFEVFHEILTGYDADFKKCSDAEELENLDYLIFSRALLRLYQISGASTYLSTSLKVVDYLMIHPEPEFSDKVINLVKEISDLQLAIIIGLRQR